MKEFSDDFIGRFAGIARLYGLAALRRLVGAHVCVVGLGGVGSWACEALARCGIGRFTLIDKDCVAESNTNRQLHALTGNYGCLKVSVMAERLKAINPEVNISFVDEFVTPETASEFFSVAGARYDLVVDAIDGVVNKSALIAACKGAGIPIVSSGGCAGKRDCLRVEVADLSKAEHDTLLKFVRRDLRSRHGFPRGGASFGVPVVFSREDSSLLSEGELLGAEVPEIFSPAGGKGRPGTVTFVTGAFGFALAQLAVSVLLGRENFVK